MGDLLTERLNIIESERYEYLTKRGVTVLFQRLRRDSIWYVICGNQIINYGQYRHDLEEWCNTAL